MTLRGLIEVQRAGGLTDVQVEHVCFGVVLDTVEAGDTSTSRPTGLRRSVRTTLAER